MTLIRTTITLPAEVLREVDAIAGPRGRSAYIGEVVARQVRRDRQRRVFEENFGALAGKPGQMSPDEVLHFVRQLRSEDRDRSSERDPSA